MDEHNIITPGARRVDKPWRAVVAFDRPVELPVVLCIGVDCATPIFWLDPHERCLRCRQDFPTCTFGLDVCGVCKDMSTWAREGCIAHLRDANAGQSYGFHKSVI